jgi:hypothetical protein
MSLRDAATGIRTCSKEQSVAHCLSRVFLAVAESCEGPDGGVYSGWEDRIIRAVGVVE